MNEKQDNFFIEVLKFSLLTLVIVLPFRMYIAKPFVVSGISMSPTFETGNYLIIDQISYKTKKEPQRSDVIVFKYPKNPNKYFIKRIIGLPNETIHIKDGDIFIINEKHPDGFQLQENYLKTNFHEKNLFYKLSNNEYFVMGDNRNNSSDSRVWGALPKNLIVGEAFLRLFPLHKIDIWPGAPDN